MVQYNLSNIEQKTIEFCRYPVPRTPIDIVRYLKMKDSNFYQKTPSEQVVKFLRRGVLDKLVEKNLLVKYNQNHKDWERARKLLSYYFSRQEGKQPRKVAELYQVNFLYLGNDSLVFNLPSFSEINLDATTLLYNLTKGKNYENFFLNFINLILCYKSIVLRDDLRMLIYRIDFSDNERKFLEKVLDVTSTDKSMNSFFALFPFQPDAEKAKRFLMEL